MDTHIPAWIKLPMDTFDQTHTNMYAKTQTARRHACKHSHQNTQNPLFTKKHNLRLFDDEKKVKKNLHDFVGTYAAAGVRGLKETVHSKNKTKIFSNSRSKKLKANVLLKYGRVWRIEGLWPIFGEEVSLRSFRSKDD